MEKKNVREVVNAARPSEPPWQPLDLKARIAQKLTEVQEKAEAAAIARMELRRELRLIGR